MTLWKTIVVFDLVVFLVSVVVTGASYLIEQVYRSVIHRRSR